MTIEELCLRDFRNYAALSLSFESQAVLVWGENGGGKTNILEAIFYLACLRSFRACRDKDLARHGTEAFSVSAGLRKSSSRVDLKVLYHANRKKEMFVGSSQMQSASDFVGKLVVVAFSPDDLQMVKGSPSIRRRFLDLGISQASSLYLSNLARYARAISQRNALLAGGCAPAGLLDAWDEQLAQAGSYITRRRAVELRKMSEIAARFHAAISDGRETLRLEYKPSVPGSDDSDPGAAKEALLAALAKARPKDLAMGITSVGPQRDDFAFTLNGMDARTFASQGQQRSAVLALKLAQMNVAREEIGEWPVLLLDDVGSELDAKRRSLFREALDQGMQVIATATEASGGAFEAEAGAFERIRIESGRVVR